MDDRKEAFRPLKRTLTTKSGRYPLSLKQSPFGHREHIATANNHVIQNADIDQCQCRLQRLRQRFISA